MQTGVDAVTAALQREKEGHLVGSAVRPKHVYYDPVRVIDGNLQSSTPNANIGHADSGLVDAVVVALEREQKQNLAAGADPVEHVFQGQVMHGQLQRSSPFAKSGQADGASSLIPALTQDQEGGTLRKEHAFHDQVVRGKLARGTFFPRIGQAESGSEQAVMVLEREQGVLAARTVLIERMAHDQVTPGIVQNSTPSAKIGHPESGSTMNTALERKQKDPLAGGTGRMEHSVDEQVMRGNLQSSTLAAKIRHAGEPGRSQDSLIKARYASTVLRVAQTTDQQTAARLVRGLAHDFPHPNERQSIADVHLSAIEAFFRLAANLDNAIDFKQRNLWSPALAAAHDWLRAVSPTAAKS